MLPKGEGHDIRCAFFEMIDEYSTFSHTGLPLRHNCRRNGFGMTDKIAFTPCYSHSPLPISLYFLFADISLRYGTLRISSFEIAAASLRSHFSRHACSSRRLNDDCRRRGCRHYQSHISHFSTLFIDYWHIIYLYWFDDGDAYIIATCCDR